MFSSSHARPLRTWVLALCCGVVIVLSCAHLAFGDVLGGVSFESAAVVAERQGSALRAVHRCNSDEVLERSEGAWAVEVDVRDATEGGDVEVWHDEESRSGLMLSKVLDTCRERGQVVILDTIHGCDMAAVVHMVAERGMFSQTRFQVMDVGDAYALRAIDGRCLVWLLNGTGGSGETLRLADVDELSDVICGVNVCGRLVGDSVSMDALAGLCGRSGCGGSPLEVCVFAYGDRSDVYGLDESLYGVGVSVLMTDLL